MNILTQFFKQKTPKIPEYVLLGGERYHVSVTKGERNLAKMSEGKVHFTLKDMSTRNFNTYLKNWYRREVRKLFTQSIEKWLDIMYPLGYEVEMPQIKIYRMSRAWGRCFYTKNLITLNLFLGATPKDCIDYITLHELCHFLVHSHSKAFYAVMTNIDPDWSCKEKMLTAFARGHLITNRPEY